MCCHFYSDLYIVEDVCQFLVLAPKKSPGRWRSILLTKQSGALAIGLCCLVLAVYNFLTPPQFRPSGGRWGWLFGFLWDYFGDLGGLLLFDDVWNLFCICNRE